MSGHHPWRGLHPLPSTFNAYANQVLQQAAPTEAEIQEWGMNYIASRYGTLHPVHSVTVERLDDMRVSHEKVGDVVRIKASGLYRIEATITPGDLPRD